MTTCSVAGCGMAAKRRGWCIKHYTRVIRYGSTDGFRPRATVTERFWAKVDKTNGCWSWTGAKDRLGYGRFNAGDSRANSIYVKPHRFAYEQLVGPIPDGLHIDHMCHNPSCVNPRHLRAVTNRVNAQNRNGLDRRSTTGYRGVTFHTPTGKYRAYIGHKNRQIHLGLFDTAEEAAKAAAEARARYYDLPKTQAA